MLSFFIREFTKRMSSDLPFYYYTLNERYREAEMPSFDVISEKSNASKEHQPRLHKLRINHVSIFLGINICDKNILDSCQIAQLCGWFRVPKQDGQQYFILG